MRPTSGTTYHGGPPATLAARVRATRRRKDRHDPPSPGTPGRGLLAEAKDAVTPRAFLLVCGYALAGLVVSYLVLMLAGRRPGGLPVRVADRTQSAGLGSGDT